MSFLAIVKLAPRCNRDARLLIVVFVSGRQAETAAARKRLEVYARNAIMRQWVQRNMQIFHEQMTADAGGAAARSDEGFAV